MYALDHSDRSPEALYAWRVPAGFPSPADDYVETSLDSTALLVRRPAATFFVRVSGPSMEEAAILDGNIFAVYKAEELRIRIKHRRHQWGGNVGVAAPR